MFFDYCAYSTTSDLHTGGAAWRRKALLRATEQAKEEGVPLAELVKERHGSLDELKQAVLSSSHASSRSDRPRPSGDGREREQERERDSRDRREHSDRRDQRGDRRERSDRPHDSRRDGILLLT
jgi:hypothetical protein